MQTFIRSFFDNFESSVEERDDRFIVQLSDELKTLFGQDTLHLVFNPEQVDESSELVTHGGYVLNTIFDFLQTRGVKAVSRLPEQFRPTRTELLKRLAVERAVVDDLRITRNKNVDVLFNFKCTFLSDEKSESIYRFGVDQRGHVFDAERYYTNDVVTDALSSESHKGSIELSRKELDVRFRSCLKKASELAKDHGRSLQIDILKRLHRNILRIKGYYGAQIDELHRNQPGYEEKRLHIEREYEHKQKEEIDNHRLRIVLRLINYHIVERTELELVLGLKPFGLSQSLSLHVIYDSFTGAIDYGHCPSCDSQMDGILVTDSGTVACRQCLTACTSCGKVFPKKDLANACTVCTQPVCRECLLQCSQCASVLCQEHSTVCEVGHEMLCVSCARSCCDCSKTLCADHSFECYASHKPVCFDHRVICKSCRKVFSSSFVLSLSAERCPSCNAVLVV